MTSLINSAIKFAALDCLGGGGDCFPSFCEVDEASDHACRSGEGTTGAVGFCTAGMRRRDGVEGTTGFGNIPFARDAVGEPDVGKGSEEPLIDVSALEEVSSTSSWSTFRLLLSDRGSSLGLTSFMTKRSGVERDAPNAGDAYRLRERDCFALPAPSQRYTPLGFFDRVLRGEVDGVPAGVEKGRVGDELESNGAEGGTESKRKPV